MIPKLKPQILEEVKLGEKVLGRVVGINLKAMDFSKENHLMKFIESINKIKTTESKLYIENIETWNIELINKVLLETNTCLASGQVIKDFNLIPILKTILNQIKEQFNTREVLLLCESKEKIKDILKNMGKDFKFITVFGCEKNYDEIYEYILEETGISIFYSYKLPKIIDKYNIIINYMDTVEFDVGKIKKQAIVFDFNENKPIARKRKTTITDFGFDFKKLSIESKFIFSDIINTEIYDLIMDSKPKIADYIYSYGDYRLLKKYIEDFLQIKILM